MGQIKNKYTKKVITVTPADFGRKIAKVFDDLKSSHCYFMMQQAYGEIGWEEAQEIIDEVLKEKQVKKSLTQ